MWPNFFPILLGKSIIYYFLKNENPQTKKIQKRYVAILRAKNPFIKRSYSDSTIQKNSKQIILSNFSPFLHNHNLNRGIQTKLGIASRIREKDIFRVWCARDTEEQNFLRVSESTNVHIAQTNCMSF